MKPIDKVTGCHYYSDRLSLCILCIPVQHGISFDCRSGHFYGKLEKGDGRKCRQNVFCICRSRKKH